MLVICLTAAVAPADAQSRREARGWLQLERDQATYRERAEPLDLEEERELEIIERDQRLDLRALQQRQRAEAALQARRERLDRLADDDLGVPRRDFFPEQRRQLERQRLQRRVQQQILPYGR